MTQAVIQCETTVLRDLLSLAKPRLSSLVLVTTGVGICVAPGHLSPIETTLVLLATLMVVGAANSFNCYMERTTDGLMHRTRHRALPAGRLSPMSAVYFGGLLSAVALPTIAIVANPLTAGLGALALLLYVAAYTPLKFKSSLALQVGAVPGAIPPLMGWTAVTNQIDLNGLALFGILFCWQFTHFLAISLYLKEDYNRAGIKTYSVVFSELRTKAMISFSMTVLIAMTLIVVPMGWAHPLYGVVAAVLGFGLLAWSICGFTTRTTGRWARQMFLATVAYLPLLLIALVVGVLKN